MRSNGGLHVVPHRQAGQQRRIIDALEAAREVERTIGRENQAARGRSDDIVFKIVRPSSRRPWRVLGISSSALNRWSLEIVWLQSEQLARERGRRRNKSRSSSRQESSCTDRRRAALSSPASRCSVVHFFGSDSISVRVAAPWHGERRLVLRKSAGRRLPFGRWPSTTWKNAAMAARRDGRIDSRAVDLLQQNVQCVEGGISKVDGSALVAIRIQ